MTVIHKISDPFLQCLDSRKTLSRYIEDRVPGENLARGRFRLVFAVELITPELKDVVEYLNAQGGDNVSVLALETGT